MALEKMAALLGAMAVMGAAQQAGPPGIGQNGVVNSASRIPTTLAGGAIARGARFSIDGVRLGSADRTTITAISANGARTPLRTLSVAQMRIEAVMPRSAPLGAALLVVTVGDQPSLPFAFEVAASNPGIFSRNQQGWGPGAIDNLDSRGARRANSTVNPAHPRQRITIVTTGLGDRKQATLVIGNRTIQTASVRAAAHDGEDEITVKIPADTPRGCYVPVYLLAAPGRASNVVTMSIRSSAGPCEPGPIPLLDASRIGVALFVRSRMKTRDGTGDAIEDQATVTFAEKNDQPVLSPLLLLPPPGTCTAYTSSFQANTVLPNSISSALMAELEGRGLDAGPKLTLSRAGQSRAILGVAGAPGLYRGRLGNGGVRVSRRARPLFLEPSEFTFEGPGGRGVGPFTITVPGIEPFEWTNRDETATVDRRKGVSIHWRGASNGRWIVILATNVDQITTALGTCLCTATGAAGEFAIPTELLANLPASIDIPGLPYDQFFVAALPAMAAPIHLPGIQGGAVVSMYAIGRKVEYH